MIGSVLSKTWLVFQSHWPIQCKSMVSCSIKMVKNVIIAVIDSLLNLLVLGSTDQARFVLHSVLHHCT